MNPRFPACLLQFPAGVTHRGAAFYLAAEEYVARHLPEDNYLFSWVLPPTIVMGRHQVASLEADLDFCRAEGIDIVRRKSGGGCIYADEGNIMFSLVTGAGAVEPIFADYATAMSQALTAAGIPACVSGRNDILLENGTKVCGNAFYHLGQHNIVHGTMLYDTNYRRMMGALTPSQKKLETHRGVSSVRSRVGLIKDIRPLGVPRLRQAIEQHLTNRIYTLTAADITAIEIAERPYHAPSYIYGDSSAATKRTETSIDTSQHIEGCGSIALHFTVDNGIIRDVTLAGDFFSVIPSPAAVFNEAYAHLPATREALVVATRQHHPESAIRNLSADALITLIASAEGL
jgi:lipoic acid synthetase/lipoate-protein ligase A